MTDFAARLSAAAARAEAALDAALPPAGTDPQGVLAAAMRHAALGGGKRLRAFLTIEAAALLGGDGENAGRGADRAAAAVEMLHAYSLVHDDMPCMDDDALRRGRPTVHVAWDEATAVLAGDALQTLAFQTLAEPDTHPDGAVRADLCLTLAQAAGPAGMVGGQMLDIAAETAATPPDAEGVATLQALKTGALIVAAAEMGAVVARAEARDRARLRGFARDLGAAFQIRDDLLDVEGDANDAGKRLRKDAEAGKATFVGALGLEGARARARDHAAAAKDALAPYGDRAAALAAAVDYTIERRA
jgi:farnesyl diphosphate synthase